MYRLLERLLSAVDDMNNASGSMIAKAHKEYGSPVVNQSLQAFLRKVKAGEYNDVDAAYHELSAILSQ